MVLPVVDNVSPYPVFKTLLNLTPRHLMSFGEFLKDCCRDAQCLHVLNCIYIS